MPAGLVPALGVVLPWEVRGDLAVFKFWWLKSVRERERLRREEAAAELEKSRELLARDQRELIIPARRAATRNHYSDLLRGALLDGYPGRNRRAE